MQDKRKQFKHKMDEKRKQFENKMAEPLLLGAGNHDFTWQAIQPLIGGG